MPRDYLYWVLVFRKEVIGLEEDATDALLCSTHAQSSQHALNVTKSWNESVRAVLEIGNVEDSTLVGLWTCETGNYVASWEGKDQRSPVTLIGDAAHPVPPVSAMGLHLAFQDASELCEALVGLSRGWGAGAGEKLEAIRAYEAAMVGRAKAVIEHGIKAAGLFFGMRAVEELKPAPL